MLLSLLLGNVYDHDGGGHNDDENEAQFGAARGGEEFSFLLPLLFSHARRFNQLVPHFFLKRLFRWLCEKED